MMINFNLERMLNGPLTFLHSSWGTIWWTFDSKNEDEADEINVISPTAVPQEQDTGLELLSTLVDWEEGGFEEGACVCTLIC